MMRDESDAILDDLLSRWHGFCRGYQPGEHSANPMFKDSLRGKGEQTIEAIAEDQLWAGVFKAMDFHVSQMEEPFRTAIYLNARNCYTGRSVWQSPRLPTDVIERAEIVAKARSQIRTRLQLAGVM